MKTEFGWTVNGSLRRYDKERNQCYLISLCQNDSILVKLFTQYINRICSASSTDNCKEMSMEDKKVLAVPDNTIQVVDG